MTFLGDRVAGPFYCRPMLSCRYNVVSIQKCIAASFLIAITSFAIALIRGACRIEVVALQSHPHVRITQIHPGEESDVEWRNR